MIYEYHPLYHIVLNFEIGNQKVLDLSVLWGLPLKFMQHIGNTCHLDRSITGRSSLHNLDLGYESPNTVQLEGVFNFPPISVGRLICPLQSHSRLHSNITCTCNFMIFTL